VLGVAIASTTALSSIGASDAVSGLGIVGTGLGDIGSAAVNVALFVGTFKVLTDLDQDWKAYLPGAVVAGAGFTAVQALGGWYVSRILTGASQMYGTFAVVLGLLSLLYLQAQITVMAAEVNVVLARDLAPRSLTGENLTAADHRALRHYAEVEERIPEETVAVDVDMPVVEHPVDVPDVPATGPSPP
jgi:uncharacterized BrkB/YihY/UPF0761 family membrane protein